MMHRFDDWLRKNMKSIIVVICLYVITYVLLTVNGRYTERPVASGRFRYTFGLAINDEFVWEPAGVKLRPYHINILGVAYYYFVKIDRKLWHRSIQAVHPNG